MSFVLVRIENQRRDNEKVKVQFAGIALSFASISKYFIVQLGLYVIHLR